MKKEETKFRQGKIDPFLKSLDNVAAETIQQKSIRGTADKILCVHGWFVWMEIKTDTGKLDALQIYKASCFRKAGGIVLIARPSNWEKIKSFLTLLNSGIYNKNLLTDMED